MEKPKDYYQLLGVPRDASLTAIRKAFRRLARLYRPGRDGARGSRDGGGASFAELQDAYETLADDERRRRYDDQLRHRPSLPLDWSRRIRRPAAFDLRRPFVPASLAAELVVEPLAAERGTTLSVEVPATAVCDACDGTGGSVLDCPRCQGDGKLGRRFGLTVHVPPRTREGTVFHVRTGDPALPVVLLTVHLGRS